MAGGFIYSRANHADNSRPKAHSFGDLRFPSQIKIYGSKQSILAGGVAPFGAVGVYVKDVDPVRSMVGADAPLDEASFFRSLAAAKLDKSLLVQFDGTTETSTFWNSLGAHLSHLLSEPGVEAISEAFDAALRDAQAVPPRGAQLYLTCTATKVHLAYGKAAAGKLLRDTAPVAASINDEGYNSSAGVCNAIFEAFFVAGDEPVARSARAEVVASVAELFGLKGATAGKAHDEL